MRLAVRERVLVMPCDLLDRWIPLQNPVDQQGRIRGDIPLPLPKQRKQKPGFACRRRKIAPLFLSGRKRATSGTLPVWYPRPDLNRDFRFRNRLIRP